MAKVTGKHPLRTLSFIVVIGLMGILSITNLMLTNTFGEVCGILHPYIFEVDVSIIDTNTGTKFVGVSNPSIPAIGEPEELDTYLRVYDADGLLRAANDDLEGLNSGIQGFDVSGFDGLVVEVATFQEFGTGSYRLTVNGTSEIQQAEDTGGETFFAAVDQFFGDEQLFEINETTVFSGSLAVEEWHEYGVYDATTPISIFLNGLDGLDTYLTIYDVDGEVLAENDDFGEELSSAILDFPAFQYEEIYLDVATFDDFYAGDYELVIAPAGASAAAGFIFEEPTNIPIRYRDETIAMDSSVEGVIRNNQRIRYAVDLSDFDEPAVNISLVALKDGTIPPRLFGDNFTANGWSSCVEYYGYVDGTNFVLNQEGLSRYGLGVECIDETCSNFSARIDLTFFGQMIMYIVWPALVILLPIIGVYTIRGRTGVWWWTLTLIFVALHVLTSSLLYVHLTTVSGIDALANVAYGIVAGAATGSAIAFMTKVLENFSIDRDEEAA